MSDRRSPRDIINITMSADQNGASDPERCPICPAAGPPVPPSATGSGKMPADEDDVELQWISCTKCRTWFHSVCVLKSSDFKETTIPEELQDEVTASGMGEWYDWADRVDKWYCKPCIDFSVSPDNPRPPRKPMAATMKKTAPKRPSSGAAASPDSKRARLGTANTEEAEGTPGPSERRPKRQAALDRPDYYNMHHHNPAPTKTWVDLIKDPAKFGRVIKEDNFPRVPGSLLCKEWVESTADGTSSFPPHLPPTLFYGPDREPLVVRPEDGGLEAMGGAVPDSSLTVDDVARLVGPQRLVDVIDVATQQSSQWPLSKWAEYVKSRNDPATASTSKVYNIISLEISGTDLAKNVRPPRIVSDIDWVENFWPFPGGKEAMKRASARAAGGGEETKDASAVKTKSEWPKVQLYCLMGMKDAWTDWHVDFAASSVYYSVHTGSKVFFFIRPTKANFAAYAQWSGSSDLQQSTWLPDMCDEVRKVTLKAGDTMLIPAGYIHAVFTPVDSIVFGGNFVHSYDIPTQLRMRHIEIETKVPQRFRFPYFDRLCWYVADRYTSDLRQLRAYRPTAKPATVSRPHARILEGLVSLAQFLVEQVEQMEDETVEDKLRRAIWNRIPSEVQDPGALAHELLWRAERELPEDWEGGEEVKVTGGRGRANGVAKKRSQSAQLLDRPRVSRTWKFAPPPWTMEEDTVQTNSQQTAIAIPGGDSQVRDAELAVTKRHQKRQRLRKEEGETVLEEQEMVFTERRTTWLHPKVEAKVEV